MNSPEDYI